jgi:hypothetical protein
MFFKDIDNGEIRMASADSASKTGLTAAGFLAEIKKERLSGREFLALIGHTGISNESYAEIKDNPGLTYARLVAILEASPLTGEDYAALLKTSRERREKRELFRKRAALEKDLNAIIASKSSDGAPLSDNAAAGAKTARDTGDGVTEEITLSDAPEETSPEEAGYDDLWGDEPTEYGDYNSGDYAEEYGEYGGSEDFDANAPRENMAKRVICLISGAVLVFASFFIRFVLTGDWFLPVNGLTPAGSYEALFAVQAGRGAGQAERVPAERVYRAEKFSGGGQKPVSLCSNSEYIFKTRGNAVNAVKISGGEMYAAPGYERNDMELIGVFLLKERLFAVYSGEYEISFEYQTESETGEDGETDRANAAKTFKFPQPCVTVAVFDAMSWNATPIAEYTQDGEFFDIIIRAGNFFLITDYAVSNDVYDGKYDGYIPAYRLNSQRSWVSLENILMREPPYSNMTVIGGADAACETAFACAATGGSANFVYEGENSLLLVYNGGGEAEAVRYGVYETNLSAPASFKVKGSVPEGFVDDRNGVLRLAAITGEDKGQSVTLHIFESNAKPVSVEKIAAGETPKGAAFDKNRAYIIAEQLYVIDTSAPGEPRFLDETDSLISAEYYYGWGENSFFSVSVEADDEGNRRGVRVTMYDYRETGAPVEAAAVLIAPSIAEYGEYMKTPAEHSRGAVAANADSGIIVVPIIDFNGIVRIEKFVILGYDAERGFETKGSRVDVDSFSDTLSAVISEGYVYAFWDDAIKSLTSDAKLLRSFTVE